MTVAYSRPPNLGNLLSLRNINSFNGPPASSYQITSQEGAWEREIEYCFGFAI